MSVVCKGLIQRPNQDMEKKHGANNTRAIEKEVKKIRQGKMMIPLVFAEEFGDHSYYFSFFNGEKLVKVRPLHS